MHSEIRAERLLVSHRPNPDVQLGFVGFLTAVDCTTGGLELLYGGTLTGLCTSDPRRQRGFAARQA